MKRERHYSPGTQRALSTLGKLIAVERRSQGRPQRELSERAGISVQTLINVEKGAPGTEIGTVFELATLLGIDLFPDVDDDRLDQRLALTPAHVYPPTLVGDDDF
jgi:transcriptional regulator with XRE-family HTH domain